MSTSASVRHVQQRHRIIRESSKSMCVLQISPELQREGWEKSNPPEGPVKSGGHSFQSGDQMETVCVGTEIAALKPKEQASESADQLAWEPLRQDREGPLPLPKGERLFEETLTFQPLRAC